MHALLNSNIGSTISLERDWFGGVEFPTFKRFFICLDSNRRRFFERYRPLIGVDGYHLKGPYRCVFLTTMSIDANYGIYPLAMCVVKTKNNYPWQYFMDKLYDQMSYNGGEGLCFISDKHKGVLKALDRVFLYHRRGIAVGTSTRISSKIFLGCWGKKCFREPVEVQMLLTWTPTRKN